MAGDGWLGAPASRRLGARWHRCLAGGGQVAPASRWCRSWGLGLGSWAPAARPKTKAPSPKTCLRLCRLRRVFRIYGLFPHPECPMLTITGLWRPGWIGVWTGARHESPILQFHLAKLLRPGLLLHPGLRRAGLARRCRGPNGSTASGGRPMAAARRAPRSVGQSVQRVRDRSLGTGDATAVTQIGGGRGHGRSGGQGFFDSGRASRHGGRGALGRCRPGR